MTFDPAFINYTHAVVYDDDIRGNPAALYMGTNRLQGKSEHITAVLKGNMEQVQARHSAVMEEKNHQVAKCFQTRALTTFQEPPYDARLQQANNLHIGV